MDQLQYDSSLEELSQEELRMLASMKRQEPQGEEHVGNAGKSCGNHSSSADKVPASVRGQNSVALIQEGSSGSSSSSPYSSEGEEEGGVVERPTPSRQRYRKGKKSSQQYYRGNKGTNVSNLSTDSSNSHSAYNTLIIHQNNSSLLADTWIPASHEFTSYGIGNRPNTSQLRTTDEHEGLHHRPSQSYSNPYENATVGDGSNSALTSSELSEIPRDYLNQLTVLKHLAKEVQQDPISGTSGTSLLRSASFSKSQPDLTQAGQYSGNRGLGLHADEGNHAKSQPPQGPRKSKKHSNTNSGGNEDGKGSQTQAQGQAMQQHQQQDDVLPSVQILEILMRENAALNAELVNARRKISTIHKLESELNKLQAAHEALFASAERRESLERTARAKLSTELKRLTAVNRELLSSGSLQNLSPSPFSSNITPDIEFLKKEIAKRDMTIAQLVSQNKELAAGKERQDIELSAQRATLAEQRTHIDILDSALTNAQANVLRLEEECRKKQEFVDKSSQLQRALSSLQLTNDKREQCEKKARTQLEGEITDLKLRLASFKVNGNQTGQMNQNQLPQLQQPLSQGGGTSRSVQNQPGARSYQSPPYTPPKYESNANLTENQLQLLQEKLKVSDEQISHLNSQVAKWEHVFSPANVGYKHPTNPVGTSTPNTPNSWTNSNSRGGTPHFFGGQSDKASMEELQGSSQSRDLECKIKDLESKLMEKDAVIRILQTAPGSAPSPHYAMLNPSHPSSNSVPSYRDSPSYSQVPTVPVGAQHFMSASMAAMMDPTVSLLYSKGQMMNQKCESEPPSYANLPLKLRLGGSGSSLVKNSNESLQLGGGSSTGGNSPNISGPGSVSSTSGSGTKSIEDQLKDLDKDLLSKDGGPGGTGSLKMQSGLCCIPGFAHSSSSARKGKISQSLLESLATSGGIQGGLSPGGIPTSSTSRKPSLTNSSSVLPPKPPSSFQSQNQGSRTSSGPPFVSSSDQSPTLRPLVTTTTAMSLSNSVDSVLSETPNGQSSAKMNVKSKNIDGDQCNVFTPAVGVPMGLPPRPMGSDSQAGKSRSLERNKHSIPGEPCAGKYTMVMYDGARCRSLDRRDLKLSLKSPGKSEEKPEKETTGKKTGVSSKAAFFGQLLTRRSPSPGREKEKKETTPKLGRRFPFGGKSQAPTPPQTEKGASGEVAEERMMLDKQGRQSQRNRISSKWNSCNTLEAVEEQSGSESPWTCRKNKGSSPKVQKQPKEQVQRVSKEETAHESSNNKKWGRIVKTPFGLRYTFGSPRIAAAIASPVDPSSPKQADK